MSLVSHLLILDPHQRLNASHVEDLLDSIIATNSTASLLMERASLQVVFLCPLEPIWEERQQ